MVTYTVLEILCTNRFHFLCTKWKFSSCVLDHPVTRQQLGCTWCLVKRREPVLAFFSSHVCIHRPSFSYCIFVLHACSVSSASKILLLFTWRSHNVFGRVIAVTIFFPLLSSVVILSEHWFQAGILSCRSFFFFNGNHCALCIVWSMVQKQSHVLSPYVSISSFWICSLLLGRCYQRSGYTLPGHEWAYPLTLHQNFLTHVVFMRILHCWFSTSLERLQNFVCRETCSVHTCAVLFVQKMCGYITCQACICKCRAKSKPCLNTVDVQTLCFPVELYFWWVVESNIVVRCEERKWLVVDR